jgi:hypothetical protein
MFLPESNNIEGLAAPFNPLLPMQIPFLRLPPLSRRLRFGPS